LLRRDPSLIPNATNEAVRLGSPIRSLTRTVVRDYELGGVLLPAGARVMVVYASANRDERKFADPHQFDVTRVRADHVGFGYGIHACAGMHLARLEMNSLLSALVARVARRGRHTYDRVEQYDLQLRVTAGDFARRVIFVCCPSS
jgi:cytochrome P450